MNVSFLFLLSRNFFASPSRLTIYFIQHLWMLSHLIYFYSLLISLGITSSCFWNVARGKIKSIISPVSQFRMSFPISTVINTSSSSLTSDVLLFRYSPHLAQLLPLCIPLVEWITLLRLFLYFFIYIYIYKERDWILFISMLLACNMHSLKFVELSFQSVYNQLLKF